MYVCWKLCFLFGNYGKGFMGNYSILFVIDCLTVLRLCIRLCTCIHVHLTHFFTIDPLESTFICYLFSLLLGNIKC